MEQLGRQAGEEERELPNVGTGEGGALHFYNVLACKFNQCGGEGKRERERERAQKQSKAKGDMDDTYLWSHSREHLQASLAELERRLGQHGLEINPDNTAIIHSCRDRGWHLHHRGEDGGMQALWGSHHGPGVTHHLWGGSGGDSDRDEPQSTTSLSQTRPPPVRPHGPGGENPAAPDGGGHVGAEAWQNTAAIFKAANSTQTAQVRRMMHPGRRPGESWEEWNVRTLRAARLAIHRAGVPRWSTYATHPRGAV